MIAPRSPGPRTNDSALGSIWGWITLSFRGFRSLLSDSEYSQRPIGVVTQFLPDDRIGAQPPAETDEVYIRLTGPALMATHVVTVRPEPGKPEIGRLWEVWCSETGHLSLRDCGIA